MFLSKVAKIIKSRGMMSLLFLFLYKTHLANLKQLGKFAEQLKLTAKIDGNTIHLNSPYTGVIEKGILMLGGYEAPERSLAHKYLPKDEPVIELGASLGVVSCAVNRLLKYPQQHIVVEANPYLLPYLTQNRDFNHRQFTIEHTAIAYGTDHIVFFVDDGSLGGSVYRGEGKPVSVPAQTLQSIAARTHFDRFNLICDIEGSEVDLFTHEMDFLRIHVGWIMVELHESISGKAVVDATIARLRSNGFDLVERIENTYCYRNDVYTLEQTEKRPIVERKPA